MYLLLYGKLPKVGIMLHFQKGCPSNLIISSCLFNNTVFFFINYVKLADIIPITLHLDLDIGFQSIFFKNGFLPKSHMACIITNYSNLRKIGHFGV